eukprot:gene4759-766_t
MAVLAALCRAASSAEVAALGALYNATGGPRWSDSSCPDWGGDGSEVCTWHGVTCNGAGGVLSIELSLCGLTGIIPWDRMEGLRELLSFFVQEAGVTSHLANLVGGTLPL